MRQRLWMIGLVTALALAGCSGESESPPGAPEDAAVERPPHVLAEVLAANRLAGKVTLIHFGAAGDDRGDRELDEMLALARTGAIPSLAYLRVEMLPPSPATEAYYRDRDLPFPVVCDAEVRLSHALGVRTAPMFMLVGKYGRVRYRGPLPAASIDSWAGALAAERVDPGGRVPLLGDSDPDGADLLDSTRLPSLDGPVRPLASYAGDRGLVIVFIDTVCPYAAAAAADLRSVGAQLKPLGLPVVAVALDDEDAVRRHYADGVAGVPVLFDDTAGTRFRWQVDSVPLVVYIDAGGRVAYRGPALWNDLGAAIAAGVQVDSAGTGYG
ncbi:MAG: redoxin domain-containing protein [Planctomycetes bacterium]|nr:redoxin domain-containing protein [Planctomycetota bacterium]